MTSKKKKEQPYQLACGALPKFAWDDWESIAAAFKDAQPTLLQQAWLIQPQPEFRPGRVRTGWTDEALLIYAELDDDDIFNPVTELNAPSFLHGDVFEMFLRPLGQSAYYEFHVTPQNQKLQLRIPSVEEFNAPRGSAGIPPAWMISSRVIESRVQICAADSQWRVLAAIPFDMVAEVKKPQPGSQWLFSFSRYDYTRQKPEPILSSSSPHQILSFHRQEEWGVLRLIRQHPGFEHPLGLSGSDIGHMPHSNVRMSNPRGTMGGCKAALADQRPKFVP